MTRAGSPSRSEYPEHVSNRVHRGGPTDDRSHRHRHDQGQGAHRGRGPARAVPARRGAARWLLGPVATRCSSTARRPPTTSSRVYGDGARVVVDPASAQYLDGASLDYKDGLQGAGFTINNPNAQRTCGCGQSFSARSGASPFCAPSVRGAASCGGRTASGYSREVRRARPSSRPGRTRRRARVVIVPVAVDAEEPRLARECSTPSTVGDVRRCVRFL